MYEQQMMQQPKKPFSVGKGCLLGCLGTFVLGMLMVIGAIVMLIFLLPEDESSSEYEIELSDNVVMQPEGESYYTTYGIEGSGIYGIPMDIGVVRDYYTTIYGDGSDTHTIMIYMVGSDLETENGSASTDIYEMLDADLGEQVNVILMTGGAKDWWMSEISDDTCQYWQVKNGEFICLEEDLGQLNMLEEDTLTNFIVDTANAFPANRYSLIMWDHGGGTFSGFGYDENYPDDTLTLANIGNALDGSDIYFDLVGFDACLMGTVETSFMLEPYADYLIASPELEPGSGWYYTDFLTELGRNPSISTAQLGVHIIDDYVKSCYEDSKRPQATLSLVELSKVPYMYEALCDYFANGQVAIAEQEYKAISVARSETKDYGESEFEQVDAIDFVERSNIMGGEEVLAAIQNAVIYYHNSHDMKDSNGIAFYFPYDYPREYAYTSALMQEIGYTEDYMEFFNQFISVMASAQMDYDFATGGNSGLDYTGEDWYNEDILECYSELAEPTYTELVIVEKGDEFVLQLTDEEWELMTTVELQVLLDDGEGYIDLGSDNVFEYDEDGDLLIAFDYTWVTLDGHTVPFYAEKEVEEADGSWYTYGVVPAVLNGCDEIQIVVAWDDENPYGYVEGYRMYTNQGEPMGKGLFQLEEGDVLEWLFDYYDYDMNYDTSYLIGEDCVVTSEPLEVTYDYVGDYDAFVYFQLTDIYNNLYDTEAIVYFDY